MGVRINAGGNKVPSTTETTATKIKVSIVDAMAEVQALEKPDWSKNCSDLADYFTAQHHWELRW